jgi:hypothetical protein
VFARVAAVLEEVVRQDADLGWKEPAGVALGVIVVTGCALQLLAVGVWAGV